MLTRHSRYLSAVRAFITAPATCTTRGIPRISFQTSHVTPGGNVRRQSSVRAKSKPDFNKARNPPAQVPYVLKLAAQDFESHIQNKQLHDLLESYIHLRQTAIDNHYRDLVISNEDTLPRIFRVPKHVFKDAITLLVTSPRREHADLHIMMVKDLKTTFISHEAMVPDSPIAFAAEMFEQYLVTGRLDVLPQIYDHLCHLSDASPSDLEAYRSDQDVSHVTDWMRRLAKVPQNDLAELLSRMLYDLPRYFHTYPTRLHHYYVLQGFLASNMVDKGQAWLKRMEQHFSPPAETTRPKPSLLVRFANWMGGATEPPIETSLHPPSVWVKPHSREYDLFLKYYARRGDGEPAQAMMAHMLAMSPIATPTRRSWHLTLAAVLADPNSTASQAESIVQDIENSGHLVHPKILRLACARGALKTWLPSEKYRIVETAVTRSLAKRNLLKITPHVPANDISRTSSSPDIFGKISDIPRTVQGVPDTPIGIETAKNHPKLSVGLNPSLTHSWQDSSDSGASASTDTLIESDDTEALVQASAIAPQGVDSPPIIQGEEFGLVHITRRVTLEDGHGVELEAVEVEIPADSVNLEEIRTEVLEEDIQDMLKNEQIPHALVDDHSAAKDIFSEPMGPLVRRSKDYYSRVEKIRKKLISVAGRGDTRIALQYYAELTEMGVWVDSEVANAIIQSYFMRVLRVPPRAHIMEALQIYKDLIDAEQKNNDVKTFFDATQQRINTQKDAYISIFNALLRALSAPVTAKHDRRDLDMDLLNEYTSLSKELLSDMTSRGLCPDQRTVSTILLLHFYTSSSHKEAFKIYRSMMALLEKHASVHPDPDALPGLDISGCRAALNGFSKLSFPDMSVAPAELWFSILADMRARGYVATVKDYTLYLNNILTQKTSPTFFQLAAFGVSSESDEMSRMRMMYKAVRHIHRRVVIDPTITPDAPLLNTLINIYQYLGHFDEAMKVFNVVWLTERMDNATLSIVFDACGHAGRGKEAILIWCKLIEAGWEFDKHSLDTWVECLCRIGQLDAACKFVCMHMGRENAGYVGKGDTQPDKGTCLILLKLSWIEGQNLTVKEKIRIHLPHIWSQLSAHYTN